MPCKVFIASSSRAVPLVKWLAKALDAEGIEARPWWRVARSGRYILKNLTNEASQCDFVAVLLTADDLRTKVEAHQMTPRDNCIFEAGLFTGALGPNPERCFLFVSVENDALPTDLQGLVYLKMTEPDGLADLAELPWEEALPSAFAESCKSAFGDNFKKMVESISNLKPCRRPSLHTLTTGELIQAEQLTHLGGSLNWNSSVLVSSDKPIERGQIFAARVLKNMSETVNYTYFFSRSTNVRIMAEVIQALAAAGLQTENPIKRQQLMADNPAKIRDNINVLRKRLKIYFVKDPPLFKFCVHNVKDKDAACYLRYSDGASPSFIRWKTGESVDDVVSEILRPVGAKDIQRQIFRSTDSFDLYAPENEDMRADLRGEVLDLFPVDLLSDVEAACFSVSKSAP